MKVQSSWDFYLQHVRDDSSQLEIVLLPAKQPTFSEQFCQSGEDSEG